MPTFQVRWIASEKAMPAVFPPSVALYSPTMNFCNVLIFIDLDNNKDISCTDSGVHCVSDARSVDRSYGRVLRHLYLNFR